MSRVFDDETGGHGGDLVRAAQQWNIEDGTLVDFSSNINPLGPPAGLLDHLKEALPGIVAYPTPQARELRGSLACFLNVQVERLLAGNGANELIHYILLWRRPKRVFVPAPSFSEYERAAILAGAALERYSLLPGEEADFVSLGSRLEQGDLLIFCNPNNPTGVLYPRRKLLPLVEAAAAQGAEVMIDESFIPLTGRPAESLRDLKSDHLWVVISLTKLWSLPGLRLGCVIGPQECIEQITRWGDPWRVNYLAQEAGIFCLRSSGYLEKSLALVEKERNYLVEGFRRTKAFHVYDGSANYLLLRGLDPVFDVAAFQDYLARRRLLVRRADNFYNLDRRYFRVAVRRRPENRLLLQETGAYLKNCRPPGDAACIGGEEE